MLIRLLVMYTELIGRVMKLNTFTVFKIFAGALIINISVKYPYIV